MAAPLMIDKKNAVIPDRIFYEIIFWDYSITNRAFSARLSPAFTGLIMNE